MNRELSGKQKDAFEWLRRNNKIKRAIRLLKDVAKELKKDFNFEEVSEIERLVKLNNLLFIANGGKVKGEKKCLDSLEKETT
jgi:hypothetical protein